MEEKTNTLPTVVIARRDEILAPMAGLKEFQVTNAATNIRANFALKDVKQARRDLTELRLSLTRPIDEQKADIMDQFRKPLATLDEIESALTKTITRWTAEEKKRLAEKKRAEEEAARLEQEAEQKKLREAAKEAAEDFRFEEAKKLEVRAETVRVGVPVLPEKKPYVRGVSEYQVYHVEIVELEAIPRQYLIPDLKTLGEIARKTDGKAVIPGVKFRAETKLRG